MANKYSGTKTEENLRTPFRVSRKRVTNTHILRRRQRKTALNK